MPVCFLLAGIKGVGRKSGVSADGIHQKLFRVLFCFFSYIRFKIYPFHILDLGLEAGQISGMERLCLFQVKGQDSFQHPYLRPLQGISGQFGKHRLSLTADGVDTGLGVFCVPGTPDADIFLSVPFKEASMMQSQIQYGK